jgi:hypothetical protein
MENEMNDIPYEERKKAFYENPASKWPKIEPEDLEERRPKRGRKPKPSKRILNTSPDHYKWWRE